MPSKRFEIRFTSLAEKDLKRLRPWMSEATRAISILEDDPLRGHPLTGNLKGSRSLQFSLRGGGEYRAVYRLLEEDAVCLVFIVGPHENIYDKAERRVAALLRSGRMP